MITSNQKKKSRDPKRRVGYRGITFGGNGFDFYMNSLFRKILFELYFDIVTKDGARTTYRFKSAQTKYAVLYRDGDPDQEPIHVHYEDIIEIYIP